MQNLDENEINAITRQTVGVDRQEINWSRGTLLVAEIGSKMLANWNKMYDTSKTIIFVVDTQNSEQFLASQAEFSILMSNNSLIETPILLLFNKTDGVISPDMSYLMDMFEVDEHMSERSNFEWFSISAATGLNCEDVLEWIGKL